MKRALLPAVAWLPLWGGHAWRFKDYFFRIVKLTLDN